MSATKTLCVASLLLLLACDIDQNPLNRASEMLDRGIALFDDQDYRQAEVFLVQAVSTYEQEGEFSKAAEAHMYLSQISLRQGQFRNAIDQAQTAFDQSTRANDFRGQARVHLQQGDVEQAMGGAAKALEHYESSYSLSSAFDDKPSVAIAEFRKGDAYYRMSQWDPAQKSYENALAYYRGIQDENNMALALMGIGEVYYRQRRYGEALNSFTQAQHSIDPDQPAADARLHLDLGNVYRAMNDGNAALRYFRDGANSIRVRKTGKEYEPLLLFSIATIYAEGGRWDDAKKFYNEAVASARGVGDRIAESYLYLFLAQAAERQIPPTQKDFQLDRRVQTYSQIAQRFQECGHKTGEAYSFVQMGNLYSAVGRLAEAREAYQRAVELSEEHLGEYLDYTLHRPYQIELGIDGNWEDGYRRLAGVLLQLRRSEDALRYLDQGHARAAADQLSDRDISIRNVGLQQDMDRFRRLRNDSRLLQVEVSSLMAKGQGLGSPALNQLRLQATKARETLMSLGQKIAASYPNYAPLTGTSPSIQVGEIQDAIPRGTLLVAYLASQEHLFIFVVSRNSFVVKDAAIGRERLLAMVDEYERLMKDPNVYAGAAGEASLPAMTRFASLSTQLYNVLIRPFDTLLDRSLLIVPGQDFENFPFQTIEREDKAGTVRYLIEITSVDYVDCFSSLKFRTAAQTRIRDIVALGNPNGKNWSVDYELRDIRSFFKQASILIGFEATWDNLRSATADVVQIASDFKNNAGNVPIGTIALSDGTTLEESIDVPFEKLTSLRAFPVMVLSNTFGQGVGLTPLHAHLLRLNGTSDVFYNAWGAERKAAKFFSEFFFTHLANGLAPGDAYRQAILNLIRTQEVNHPFSWGQFFHYGIG